MSQKPTLFQMVGFLHTRCHLSHHLELTASQHLFLWIPYNKLWNFHSHVLSLLGAKVP